MIFLNVCDSSANLRPRFVSMRIARRDVVEVNSWRVRLICQLAGLDWEGPNRRPNATRVILLREVHQGAEIPEVVRWIHVMWSVAAVQLSGLQCPPKERLKG